MSIAKFLRTPISKNICELLLLIVVIYYFKKLNKIIQESDWPFVWFWNKIFLFYTLSFVFIRYSTRCHSLSLIIIFCFLVVIRCHSLSFIVTSCHSLSFVVTLCTTHYYSLSFVVPLVAIRCHPLYHSLSIAVTRCTTRCQLLSLVAPFVCLSIRDLNDALTYNHKDLLLV